MALSDFLNGYTSVLFIHNVLYAHFRQHKKILCCTKNCCVNKKIFHIEEVNVAQQNYKSQKNMLWRQ